jgi:glucose/arabinose dehydrogenase
MPGRLRPHAAAALVVLAACGVMASRGGAHDRRKEASTAAPSVRLLLLGRFRAPTYLAAPPGDARRRVVVERAGRLVVVRDGRRLPEPFLDLRGRVQTGGESGMLSMAFPPDYERSRRFYVYYTDNRGFIRVEEFQRASSSEDRALPGSGRLVIRHPHYRFNHKGGQLQFGPDGMLYMGFGDGGGMGDPDRNAQDLGRLLGKLLRLDPRPGRRRGYRIPPGNPFARRPRARDEVYAYGLRNPYRFSFDRARGHLVVGDVGQSAVEEIDFARNRGGGRPTPRGGQNYGWSIFEGRRRFRAGRAPGHVPPVLERTHAEGFCSIIGGYVIRDRSLGRLYGVYVYGDLCDPRLRVARLAPGRARGDRPLGVRVPSLVSFGEDARGRVYAVSLRGPVYRLAPRR